MLNVVAKPAIYIYWYSYIINSKYYLIIHLFKSNCVYIENIFTTIILDVQYSSFITIDSGMGLSNIYDITKRMYNVSTDVSIVYYVTFII